MATEVYVDATALLRLARPGDETAALRRFLADERVVTVAVTRAELARELHRVGHPDVAGTLDAALAGIRTLPVDTRCIEAAAALDSAGLDTLDTLHLAAATGLGAALGALVTYDDRRRTAARTMGMRVRAPR